MPDINFASETNTAIGQSQIVQYSELNLAYPLSWVKTITINWATETDFAENQALVLIYSTKDIAMSVTFHFEPAVEPPELDVTLGGARPVGTFGPIIGSEFEIEIPAHISFTRRVIFTLQNRRKPLIPAVLEFTAAVDGHAEFNKILLISHPGVRIIPLHYSQALREDRELIELIESGVL